MKYSEIYPSKELGDYVASYWENINPFDTPQKVTICPDGYFKLIIQLVNGKISAYFLTGLWTTEMDIVIQPRVITYGIRFKIIAPEYILRKSITNVLNTVEQLSPDFMGVDIMSFDSFSNIVKQFERILKNKIPAPSEIYGNRLRLSQFLYSTYGDIQAKEVANQIYWSQREINRYLNKYLGISLKKYLNIQKCYRAYLQIREGQFFPEKGFFDQAHFIREIKKDTGQTPTFLPQWQNDQFIQLKNIKKL